jgi:hypothetical protein
MAKKGDSQMAIDMRLRMMLNWHSAKSISKQSSGDPARRRMQMQVIVVLIRRPSTGSNENTELERFELEDLKHIPRVGDRLFWGGRDYTVIEVTWDLQGDSVTIGAEF